MFEIKFIENIDNIKYEKEKMNEKLDQKELSSKILDESKITIPDNFYMKEALKEARKAYEKGEVPIGAVIVKDNEIIGRGHNLRETGKDPTLHAEIIAIREAAKNVGGWRLIGCSMYVTIEPCAMCAGALVNSRIDNLVIGSKDPKMGACGSIINLVEHEKMNHIINVTFGIMEEECSQIVKGFFKDLRNRKKSNKKREKNNMIELFKTRRSIRKYVNKKIELEKIEKLKQIALMSPTAKNKRGWEFVFVENKETLKKLSEVKPTGGKMLEDAALGIVIAVSDKDNDAWIEDGSSVSAYLHLAAHDLGLGSCWVQIRNRMKDYEKGIYSEQLITEMLGIPDNLKIVCILAVGYPDEDKPEYDIEKLDYSKIHNEKY